MTQSNTRVLVQEALEKGWAIYGELKVARDEANMARTAFNELKARQSSEALREQGDAALARLTEQTASAHSKAMAAAQVRLDRATDEFNKAAQVADEVKRTADSKASEEWRKRLADETQKLTLLSAEAQANAHIAEQRASALQASLDRFKKQTLDQLGVDLGTILETA